MGQHIVMVKAATMTALMQNKFTVGTPFKKQDAVAMATFISDTNKDNDHTTVSSPAVYPVTYKVDKVPVGIITDNHHQDIYSTHGEAAVTWLALTVA